MKMLGTALFCALALYGCYDSRPTSTTSAMNAVATIQCPVLNGTYQGPIMREGDSVDVDTSVTIATRVENGAYYYRFNVDSPEEFLGNGPAKQGLDGDETVTVAVACDARSVRLDVQEGKSPAVSESYQVVDQNHLKLLSPGAPFDGVILTKQ